MKKIISILCVIMLVLSLVACQSKTTYSDKANSSIVAKVTSINGSTITIQLGELIESSEEIPSKPDENGQVQNPNGEQSEIPQQPSGDQSEAPQQPSGEQNQPPQKPDGENSNDGQFSPNADGSNQGQMPTNQMGETDVTKVNFTESDESLDIDISDASIVKDDDVIEVSEISQGDIIRVAFDSKGAVKTVIVISSQYNNGSGFSGSDSVTQGSSANTISEDGSYSNETYTSSGDDENALRVDGASVTLDSITVDKSSGSSSNTENGDFYGVNAGLLATNGANVIIKNANVTTSAQNGNGIFSYGSSTTVSVYNTTITTTADNSGGIQTTGGATTIANNLTVTTSGNSSAAIRSDRGGGTVKVSGGTYTSNGYNSPAVYSTADITVSSATLTANNSEALVIEGKNSITLNDCIVSGNMSDDKGTSSDENVHNVMIYQSMSGDADVGTSSFTMTGGSLTSKNGDMFYVTNTHCILSLSNVKIVNEDTEAYLLRVVGNSASHGWGSAGSNGGQVELTCDNQTLEGNIIVDSISSLNMILKNGSTFTGSINIVDNEQNGSAVSDNIVLTIESGCVVNLTGDCTVSSLTNNGTINYNGYSITLADGTVLK